jgi:hypothetical protein
MLRRVKIKVVPKAKTGYQVQGSLYNSPATLGGADYNANMGAPDAKVKRTISRVPRKEANLEAEGGETVVGNLDGSMMPSFKTIVGPRHSSGGVPLNLPDDSFIFSDTKSMMITDPVILKMFNKKPKKGGYTPAELSKKFDINKYRELLQNPDADKIDVKTAELMIKNSVLKLGALALAQESKKAFPQGIPEIAKPYMEANGIAEEDLIPQEPQPQQQNPEMQNQEMEQEMPMEMPNGEPIAMPQEEMLQPGMDQPAPMAAYGMSMGGYDMPDYMAYGGMFQRGGPNTTRQQSKTDYIKDYGIKLNEEDIGVDRYENVQGKSKIGFGNAEENLKSFAKWEKIYPGYAELLKEINKPGGPGKNNPKVKQFQTWINNDYIPKQATELNSKRVASGKSAYTESELNNLKSSLISDFGFDNTTGQRIDADFGAFTSSRTPINFDFEKVPDKAKGPCQCEDATQTGYQAKVNGVCPCDAKESPCECTDPDTGETYDPGEDADGNCNECTKEYPGETPEKENPKWWLQDNINTMGAAQDLASIKKYMPWEARVDLEEPRPTFLDPTRELAAQSEQANIASQASASFAGPQGLGARNAATQGNAAAQAANTLGNINNQNVNIANQFEANQIGVRNQEQAMNQQMATRRYDKNVIANQQFDNAKRQGRKALRDSYTTAITNRAKTDAMNQMYPNYQVDPESGGFVDYTPTDKTLDKTKEEDIFEYRNKLKAAGWSEKEITAEMARKFGKKFGGAIYGNGGGVYVMGGSVYPFLG